MIHVNAENEFYPDSFYAWRLLLLALFIATVGSIGQWSVVVVIPYLQSAFNTSRSIAAISYTVTTIGFAFGGFIIGYITDKVGIVKAMYLGLSFIVFGYTFAGLSMSLGGYIFAQFLIGFGASSTFAPLMAEASHWFIRRRGIAMGIAGSGYYLSGAIWPPLIDQGVQIYGLHWVMLYIAIFCLITMSSLIFILKFFISKIKKNSLKSIAMPSVSIGVRSNNLTLILCIASFSCCVAMAIPQVQIVSICGDLGFGTGRGAQMLSLMLAFGAVSRVGSGILADKIGGIPTLLISSLTQAIALGMYMYVNDLISLYIVSSLFGLFQGGIVSSYAIIVRETMQSKEAATRVGLIVMVSLLGMSFGGWLSGVIFDHTASYKLTFLNGVIWNFTNIIIISILLIRVMNIRHKNSFN